MDPLLTLIITHYHRCILFVPKHLANWTEFLSWFLFVTFSAKLEISRPFWVLVFACLSDSAIFTDRTVLTSIFNRLFWSNLWNHWLLLLIKTIVMDHKIAIIADKRMISFWVKHWCLSNSKLYLRQTINASSSIITFPIFFSLRNSSHSFGQAQRMENFLCFITNQIICIAYHLFTSNAYGFLNAERRITLDSR